MKKVSEKEFRQEIRRIKEETNINPFIKFTYDTRPVIDAQVSIAGIGALSLEDAKKFSEDLEKVIKIVDTFKYQGYELDYAI